MKSSRMNNAYRFCILAFCSVLSALPAHADATHAQHAAPSLLDNALSDRLKITLKPASPLVANRPVRVTMTLARAASNTPVTFADLREMHTKKLHLLIIDPTLTDYHHVHPTPTDLPGTYTFDFTPAKSGSYRVWADVTLSTTDAQQYVRGNMGTDGGSRPAPIKTLSSQATVDGLTFTLTLDDTPRVNSAVLAHVNVSRDGVPFTQLEPVMGAFAHMVGFAQNERSVLHVHPLGAEPTSDAARGGPTLDFHIEPKTRGFVKLFAQVRVGGRDVFVPFGIEVK